MKEGHSTQAKLFCISEAFLGKRYEPQTKERQERKSRKEEQKRKVKKHTEKERIVKRQEGRTGTRKGKTKTLHNRRGISGGIKYFRNEWEKLYIS